MKVSGGFEVWQKQVHIATKALMDIFFHNKITNETIKIAEQNNISLARLHAMTIFLETKGPPKQFMNS